MKNKYVRKIQYEPEVAIDFSELQSCYINVMTGWLVPNTEIYNGDRLLLKINSLGCAGENIMPEVPTIGYFGDSGTFGFGRDNWPRRVYVPGTQNLNASIEGHPIDRVVEQYLRLKDEVNFVAGVFYTGWHNIVYNRTGEDYWREQLDRIEGLDVIVHCTAHTCLIAECLEKGVEPLLSNEGPRAFEFWGDQEGTVENVGLVLRGIQKFNGFLAEYCAEKGRVLIDLDAMLKPQSYEEIPDVYWDVCHVRPGNWPKIAVEVSGVLANILSETGVEGKTEMPVTAEQPPKNIEGKTKQEGFGANIYPIW